MMVLALSSLDGWIIAAGILCAVSAALLGNFLVLRRLSLLGDAISHAVLPGLAGAFLLTGSRSSLVMFLGAAMAGIFTALLTEWIRREGRVDEGASLGVVFTSLFALGLILIVQAADHVDLDASCVLYGAIEMTPLDTVDWGRWQIPRVIPVLATVLVINLLFVVGCYKELKISSFDPGLATAQGIPSGLMHYLLTSLVALTAVASFEAVGNILVVAMLVATPAAAYLCTDRLPIMISLSVGFAAASAVLGHLAAVTIPKLFGLRSTTTAGMMAVVAGLLFALAAFLAPRHGILVRWWQQRRLSWQITIEDILATLYRLEERNVGDGARIEELIPFRDVNALRALKKLLASAEVRLSSNGYELTEPGRRRAATIVRSHRLWEHYLVHQAGLPPDRIHQRAELLEHFTNEDLREKLNELTSSEDLDPHGSPIPPEPSS